MLPLDDPRWDRADNYARLRNTVRDAVMYEKLAALQIDNFKKYPVDSIVRSQKAWAASVGYLLAWLAS